MRRKVVLAGFCLLLLLPVLSVAESEQDYNYAPYLHRWAVFGGIGTGSWGVSDPTAGLMPTAGFLYRPFPRAGFEVSVRHLSSVEEFRSEEFYEENSKKGQTITGSAHYYFSEDRYQPYVLLGGGLTTVHHKSVYSSSDYQDSFDVNESSFVIEAGAGADIFLTHNLSFRPDARLLIGWNGSIQGSLNLCYHW